jgi:hypothetical protein
MKYQRQAPAPEVGAEGGLVRMRLAWLADEKLPGSPRGAIVLADRMSPATAELLADALRHAASLARGYAATQSP